MTFPRRIAISVDWADCVPLIRLNGMRLISAWQTSGNVNRRVTIVCVNGINEISISLDEASSQEARCDIVINEHSTTDERVLVEFGCTASNRLAVRTFDMDRLPAWRFLEADIAIDEAESAFAEIAARWLKLVRSRDSDGLLALGRVAIEDSLGEYLQTLQVEVWRDSIALLLAEENLAVSLEPREALWRDDAFGGRLVMFGARFRDRAFVADGRDASMEVDFGLAKLNGQWQMVR